MKFNLIIFSLITALCCSVGSYAQTKSLKELHIGDQLPNILLKGWLKDSTQTISTNDLNRHRLLLLDFWATWCGPCIDGLGKNAALKKTFGEKIEIVAIGYEKRQTILDFFKRNPLIDKDAFRILTKDTILTYHLFPHHLLPHLVWIDSTGKVFAITSGTALTESNVQKAIDRKSIIARAKIDNMNFSTNDIFKPFHLMDTVFLSRSILTPVCKGIVSFDSFQANDPSNPGKPSRIFMGNLSIRSLYWRAAFGRNIIPTNFDRMIFEVKDSLKYMSPKYAPESFKNSKYLTYEDWAQENLYCYELKLPKAVSDTILNNHMIADLNRYLNLNGRFETRMTNCYILKYRPLNNKKIQRSNSVPKVDYQLGYPNKLQSQNTNKLLEILNRFIIESQIVDGTNLPSNFKFDMNLDISHKLSKTDINLLLEKYGFHIGKGMHKANVFVISEN